MAALLRAIKSEAGRSRDPWKLTGIVTVSDNGGSSGRLRAELGGIPPGDLRNCLSALTQEESVLSDLLNYRFKGEGNLAGHSLGNLMLLAMADLTGDWVRAIRQLSGVLVTVGRLYPSTVVPVTLCAEDFQGGRLPGRDGRERLQASSGEDLARSPGCGAPARGAPGPPAGGPHPPGARQPLHLHRGRSPDPRTAHGDHEVRGARRLRRQPDDRTWRELLAWISRPMWPRSRPSGASPSTRSWPTTPRCPTRSSIATWKREAHLSSRTGRRFAACLFFLNPSWTRKLSWRATTLRCSTRPCGR